MLGIEKNENWQSRHYYLTVLFVFLMPVYQKAVPIVIVLLLLNTLSLGKGAFRIPTFRANWSSLALIGFYLWHVLGMLWSSNSDFGWFDLQIKLSFLLLPWIYGVAGTMNSDRFRGVMWGFVWGCLAAVFIGVTSSVLSYYSGESPFINLYDVNISPVLHIGYFAMYLNMGLIAVVYLILRSEDKFYSLRNAGLIGVAFALVFAIFLSTSRNGFLSLVVILLLISIYGIVKFRRWLLGFTLLLLSWIVITTLAKGWFDRSVTLHGFEQVGEVMATDEVGTDARESTAVRVLIWRSCWEIIQQKPILGTGTGDIKDELMHQYKTHNYIYPYERQYNAHNQYLQTFAALGIPGIVLLLLSLSLPFFLGLRQFRFLDLLFSIIISTACLTESILEVQAGVVFFAFFVAFFSNNSSNISLRSIQKQKEA
ncbi:O-antigen ligase family protein [bacterium SCSIO 12741]|nr:O-antigen ligase family protein [bacterium SCSIO 12741]